MCSVFSGSRRPTYGFLFLFLGLEVGDVGD